MDVSITLGQPRTDSVRSANGQIMQQIVVEEAEHEMTIRASTRDLQEVLKRLQGMPGIPIMAPESPPTYDDLRAVAAYADYVPDPGELPFMYDTMKPQLATMDVKKIDRIALGDWGVNWQNAARFYIGEAEMEAKRLAVQARKIETTPPPPEPIKIMDPNFPREIDVS